MTDPPYDHPLFQRGDVLVIDHGPHVKAENVLFVGWYTFNDPKVRWCEVVEGDGRVRITDPRILSYYSRQAETLTTSSTSSTYSEPSLPRSLS